MLFKEGELKLLWPFYVFYFVYGLSTMIFPFMIIYFVNIGLSFTEIGFITASFGLAMFLFELPTGSFADRVSRKASVLVGLLIVAFAVFSIPFSDSFWVLLVLWALAGIGMTFLSGAEEAWVIDNLAHHVREDLNREYFIKVGSIAALGAVFASLLGAWLVSMFSIGLLWYVFGVGFMLNFFVLLFFAHERYVPGGSESVDPAFKEGFRYAFTHRPVLLLLVAYALVRLTLASDNATQPLLVGLGMPEAGLGFLYAASSFVVIFTPYIARRFESPKRALLVLVPLIAITPIPLLFVTYPNYLVAAFIMILTSVLVSIYRPVHFAYFQEVVPKQVRARVTSASSMVLQLSVALMTIVAGWLMDLIPLRFVFVGVGVFAIAAWFVYGRVIEEKTVQS